MSHALFYTLQSVFQLIEAKAQKLYALFLHIYTELW